MDAGELQKLKGYLRGALSHVHPEPERISHDEELLLVLVDLYDEVGAGRLWRATLAPYIAAQRAGLRNVWCEHATDPWFELMDRPECLLVFERADRQRARLRECWPGPASTLSRVSEVWGVPL